jgi:Glycosyl hydrolase catalytic core
MLRFSHFSLNIRSQTTYLLLLLLLLLLIIPVIFVKADTPTPTTTISVNGTSTTGILNTRLSTNNVWSGEINQTSGAQARLNALHAPLVRIHVGDDGWPVAMPEVKYNNWDFSALNTLVNDVRANGGYPLMNIKFAPDWMWTCKSFGGVGTLKDLTFNTFAKYMASVVSYYNKGSMTTETGQVLNNPAGTNNHITYWEIWNEPDFSNETPCHPADWSAALTPKAYVTMWNAVVPQMRAVDPTIKVVGPATANVDTGYTPEYIPTLMASATYKPDAVSYHGYGGWQNSQTDLEIFDGGPDTDGLAYIVNGVDKVRAWAPGKPIWITEMNVNADWGNDPAKRPWTAYGVAWGATAFRNLALKGVGIISQYDFIDSAQFGLINDTTGTPYLPYWRNKLLSQAFPPGSTILSSSTSKSDILPLAVQKPNGTISILVVNRQVNSNTSVGGPGLPAVVAVRLQGITPTAISLQQIDRATNPATGPITVSLPVSTAPQVSFAGYGMAILTIHTNGTSGTVTPTPTITPPSTPTPTPTITPPPTPTPTATATGGSSLTLYDNAVSSAFTDNSFSYSSRTPCDTTAYVSAPCSYAITYQAYGAIEFIYKNGSINPSSYKSLEYNVNTAGQPINDLGVIISDNKGQWINEVVLSSTNITQSLSGGWVHISIPLSQLDATSTPIGTIDLENALNKSINLIRVDDVQFVGS